MKEWKVLRFPVWYRIVLFTVEKVYFISVFFLD
jgi:hypothetical protein